MKFLLLFHYYTTEEGKPQEILGSITQEFTLFPHESLVVVIEKIQSKVEMLWREQANLSEQAVIVLQQVILLPESTKPSYSHLDPL